MEALNASMRKFGQAAQQAADNIIEAFAAAARHPELKRRQRLVISNWLHLWLLFSKPNPTIGRKRRRRRARGRARMQG
jgi:hypothetical protein